MKFAPLILAALLTVFTACDSSTSTSSSATPHSSSSFAAVSYGTFIDTRDSQAYKTVQIGTHTWMAQNLNYGTKVIDSGTATQVQDSGQKFCYNNADSSCANHGALYQWHIALQLPDSCAQTLCASLINTIHQGICPTGWHLPKSTDWDTLALGLGNDTLAGYYLKLSSTGFMPWDSTYFNNNNPVGFSAFPLGIRQGTSGFNFYGSNADFWDAEEYGAGYAKYHLLISNMTGIYSDNFSKLSGIAVRCIQN